MKREPTKKLVRLNLDPAVLRQSAIICASLGISRSELVERLWRKYLNGEILLVEQPTEMAAKGEIK